MTSLPTEKECEHIKRALWTVMSYIRAADGLGIRESERLFQRINKIRRDIISLKLSPEEHAPTIQISTVITHLNAVKNEIVKTSGLMNRSPLQLTNIALQQNPRFRVEFFAGDASIKESSPGRARSINKALSKRMRDETAPFREMPPTDEIRGVNKKRSLEALDFVLNEFGTEKWGNYFNKFTKGMGSRGAQNR